MMRPESVEGVRCRHDSMCVGKYRVSAINTMHFESTACLIFPCVLFCNRGMLEMQRDFPKL